jgi:tetratricopeptide (TPR) repeat protein
MQINFWNKGASSAPRPLAENGGDWNGVSIYQKVVQWVIYSIVFLLPIFFLPWTSGIIEMNKQLLLAVAAGIALVAWLLDVVISGKIEFRRYSLDQGVLAILGASVVATVLSVSSSKSIFGMASSSSESLVTIFSLAVLYFLAVNVFYDGGKKLSQILAGSISLLLVFGLLQLLSVYIFKVGFIHSRAFNTVGTVNSLAVLAAIALPLLSKIKLSFSRFDYLDFSKVGMIAGLIILTLMNWWVIWAIAISGMLALVAFDSLSGRGFKLSKLVLPMSVIVIAVFLMIVKFNVTQVKNNLPTEIAPSLGLSWALIKETLNTKLINGYGPENFLLVFDRYGAQALSNSNFSDLRFFDSASQMINFVISGGVVMVVALLLFIWSLVMAFWHYRDAENKDSVGVFATVFALFVASLLYPFNTTLMFVWFIVLALVSLSIGSKVTRADIEYSPVLSLSASLGFIVGLILVLTSTYFVAVHYLADVNYAKASTLTDKQKSLDLLTKSVSWNPGNDVYYRDLSQVTLKLLSEELNKKADNNDTQRSTRIQNYITSSIATAKKAVEVGPDDSNNWYNLGVVYHQLVGLVDGTGKLAEEAYLGSVKLRPGDPGIYNRLGLLKVADYDFYKQLINSNNANAEALKKEAAEAITKSESYFKEAIKLSENYGQAIYNLGMVYDRQGRLSESIKQLEKILPANANDPNILFELGLLYYRANRKDDSLGALQRSLVLAPSFANAHWYISLILEERKDIPGAISHLEKILETDKDNQTVLTKLEQLKSGKVEIPPAKVIDQKPL